MEIDIKATLILCGEDMLIERGQHLMVVGNVCVGVYTGELPGSLAQRTIQPVKHLLKAIESSPPQAGKSKPAIKRTRDLAPHVQAITVEKILSLFETDEALISATIASRLGVAAKDESGKARIWRLLEQLVRAKSLIRSDKPVEGTRAFGYTLGKTRAAE